MFSFLTKCVILNLSPLYSVWEAKPNCLGEPLKPEQFSKEGDVGFLRDVCVDIVARNIYNNLRFPVSKSCEKFAKMRTSTGSFKYFKWKRSSTCNEKATNEIMTKAEALMEELLNDIIKNVSANTNKNAGEIVYEHIKEAKCRLIDAEAVAEDSHIVDQLEDMKILLCKHCAISENKDMKDAIQQFISNSANKNGLNILNTRIEDNVFSQTTETGLFRLIFEFGDSANTSTGSVIMKIPSLAYLYHTKWKHDDLYSREAAFYATILPTLYKMGQCRPFAPKAFVITENCALVLEDLSNTVYNSPHRLQSLDLDHSIILLNVLARFHALGYVYFRNLDENNPIVQLIGVHQSTKRKAISKVEFDDLCKMVKPLLSETLYQKMLIAEKEILAELPIENKNDEGGINVIMHGDLQRKNFLFKYGSNRKVSGVKLIDWQFSSVGSPALDLIEFFVHNLHEEIFEANEDSLLDFYIGIFNGYLSVVQFDRTYSRYELNQDIAFFKNFYFRVLSAIVVYWDASRNSENHELIANNIAKWIMFFEKKGYI